MSFNVNNRVIQFFKRRFDNYMYPIIMIYSAMFIVIIASGLIRSIVDFDLQGILASVLGVIIVPPFLVLSMLFFQFWIRLTGFDKYIANFTGKDKYLRKDK